MGLFSWRAVANASSPHGYQSTGLCACWRRYGDFSWANRFLCSEPAGLCSATFSPDVTNHVSARNPKRKRLVIVFRSDPCRFEVGAIDLNRLGGSGEPPLP